MKISKRILSLILSIIMIISCMPTGVSVVDAADTYSRINIQASEATIYNLLKEQYIAKGQNVELVYNQTEAVGDIVVYTNGASSTYGAEGYGISVADGKITVTAAAQAGAVYGLQDVLKQLESGNAVSNVAATQPFKATRALFVDCGRKYFSVNWFEEIIREMAWNGMNTLYISFSNDEGFRLLLDDMSLSFDNGSGTTVTYDDEFMSHLADNPESVNDSEFLANINYNTTDGGYTRVVTNYDNNRYLTQSDMERILTYAKVYGINVIPELNSPGHFGQVLWYFPEYRIQGTWFEDGQPHYGLDLTNAEAVNFGKAFVQKYIDFFAANGCTAFCVGGDEYEAGSATNQQIADYTNALSDYAESRGMTAYSWNDGQAASSGLLNNDVVVNCWDGNNNNYQSINLNSNYLYYVLKTRTTPWKPNAQTLYETWTPLTYAAGEVEDSSSILGAALAIWCDEPSKETPTYIFESILPSIQAFGYRMWNYSESTTPSLTYSEFTDSVTSAPNVSAVKALSLTGYTVSNSSVTLPAPRENIESTSDGYYLVDFTASASTSTGWYQSGDNLIDGNSGTYAWTNAAQSVGSYIQVDIGSVQTVEDITLTSTNNANDYCENADVLVSEDGENWVKVGNFSGQSGTAVTTTYQVDDDIRYIRVQITKHKDNWWQMAEISWDFVSDSLVIEDGIYVIVNGTNKAMTNTATTNNYGGDIGFSNKEVTITDNKVENEDSVIEWTFTRQNNGKYYIQDSDGNYLNIVDKNHIKVDANTAEEITIDIYNGKVQLSDNNDIAVNFFTNEGAIFSAWSEALSDSNNLQTLYKKQYLNNVVLSTAELYNLILTARNYILTGNSDDKYGDEEFADLALELTSATEVYLSAFSDQNNYDADITQAEIDEAKEKLEKAIQLLELSDKTINYIEIPIEILDFRADGVLFEYAQNAANSGLYELLTDTKFGEQLNYGIDDEGNAIVVNMPGELGDRYSPDPINGWNEDTRRIGLMENYLVDGKPVYKEATVDYVAKLIAKGYSTDLSESASGWNNTIYNKINELYTYYDSSSNTNSYLGSWSETLAKTSTGANGGMLIWEDIETCYDLSYYILNNLWRATDSTDGTKYNMYVADRNTARLLYDGDGWYHLDSTYETNYVGEYIYNPDLTTENTNDMKFTPINGLGYESSNSFGDTTDVMEGINSHFTVHASGAFVYNADENLDFYFDGDDDVYFYINGHLVLDLGGAHSHCDGKVVLNEIAADIGLNDGGIYTFDMFYAERHTDQANLAFKTNIKIMDTMSTTSKGQYNAETGESIAYGAIVDAGTEVAYSFELMNLRSVNITDITFVDDTLGAHISKNAIILYDSTLTNGSTTTIEDIIVYYRTYDRQAPNEAGTINSSEPVPKTVDEMVEMINTANTPSSDGSLSYRAIPEGTYAVDVQTEEELKTLLELGISIDTQISVYGFKRTVVESDRPYINTLLTNAYYISNSERHALNGVASQKLTVLDSFTDVADVEKIVIDYGKPINIDISKIEENLHLNTGVTATFYGITPSGVHNQTRTSATSILGTELNKAYTSSDKIGQYTLLGDAKPATTIQMQPMNFLSEKEEIYAAFEIKDQALADTPYSTYYLLVAIEIYPATSVYYETDFASDVFTFGVESWVTDTSAGWSDETDTTDETEAGEEDTLEIQDEGVVGSGLTYGYDSSYTNDSLLSDSSAYKAIGSAETIDGAYTVGTTARFTFTGTGFDIISRTGAEQGLIKVTVNDSTTGAQVKKISVLNKSESSLELYQIPVVSVEALPYGTYDVLIEVDKAVTHTNPILSVLNRGGEFYFDAIRIYDPLMTADANAVYETDKEAYAIRKEVGNLLISAKDFDITTEAADGAVFIDRTQNIVNDISSFTELGPNNEVYLSPGYAIAFKIETSRLPDSVDVGVKSIQAGSTPKLSAAINPSAENITRETKGDITSATALYTDLIGNKNVQDLFTYDDSTDMYYAYIVLMNTAEGEVNTNVLSITDIKLAYSSAGTDTATYSITSDSKVVEVASAFMTEALTPDYDVLSAKFGVSNSLIFTYATMTVVTESDVEELKVSSDWISGSNTISDIPAKTSYIINEDGEKVWTVEVKTILPGERTYTIIGYGADGEAGAVVSDVIATTLR